MKILLDNVDTGASNGPNSFGKQLSAELNRRGDIVINLTDAIRNRRPITIRPDVQLAFIETGLSIEGVPLIQRLDGIYYNSDPQYGDWWNQNKHIDKTYSRASGVIFQSPFSKRLVESFFDEKPEDDVTVINNGVDLTQIAAIPVDTSPEFNGYDRLWMSAANWRPHKRLPENVRYFLEHSGDNDLLLVAGTQSGPHVGHPRIRYLGELPWTRLISLYKRAGVFVHLAYHDNCPNVIVDARACGCHIVCASCAGSTSIAGLDATVVVEDEWDPQPIELYKPPQLDFTRTRVNDIDSNIDIRDVTRRYVEFMGRFIK